MIFWGVPSSPGAASPSTGASATGAGGGSGFAGATETGAGGGSCGPLILEIGGRMWRLATPSASVRFGRGFFSSINETVSTASFGGDFGAGAGAGVAGLAAAGGSFGAVIGLSAETRCRTGGVAACPLGGGAAGVGAGIAAGVAAIAAGGAGVGGAGFAGASTFVFFTSFLDAVVVLDEAAALAGFFAVAGLRAGVLLVVLVGISFKNTPDHSSFSEKLRLCRRGLLVNGFMDLLCLGFIHR